MPGRLPETGMELPTVVVVDAQTPGNVGTIARAMKNFGFYDLRLVDPPDLDPDGEAYGYAGQAREDVLPNATELTFPELVDSYHTVGFTAVTNEDGSSHVRFPYKTPRELAKSLGKNSIKTALVFGRERTGLHNEELARLDEICAIPANPEYPVLNLGQAATIVLYELRTLSLESSQLPEREEQWAKPSEVERFHDHVATFLDRIDYSNEKKAKTLRLIRRLVGRATPTSPELTTLRGVMRQATRNGDSGTD